MGPSPDWTASTSCESFSLALSSSVPSASPSPTSSSFSISLFWPVTDSGILSAVPQKQTLRVFSLFFLHPKVSLQIPTHSSLPAKFNQSTLRPQSLRYRSPQDPTLDLEGKYLQCVMTYRAPLPFLLQGLLMKYRRSFFILPSSCRIPGQLLSSSIWLSSYDFIASL